MVIKKRKAVTISVDIDFFEKVFEPPRQSLSKRLGTDVTQRSFTKMAFKSGFRFDPNKLLNEKPKLKSRKKKR